MTKDLKAQLEISADASGVESGVAKAKRSLADLGVTAKREGEKASEGLKTLGGSGDGAGEKIDRATKRIIGSIQRTTAVLEAGGRSNAKYFETLAAQRGVDISALKPYLDQLDAVRIKQEAARTGLLATAPAIQQIGVSARQTAAALRGVPAQFTDIVTSLQAGQSPITVFLQQGGQLKDMFGGVGPAARALGGYIVGLVNPLTLAAGAVAALGFAYFQAAKESDAFAKAIIFSGNAAGLTVGQMQLMAQRIDAITGTQAAASAAIAEFAASGYVASQSIERFSLLALKMERETGQAVKKTAEQFTELGKSPLEAATKLNETTNFLTASVYRQIKALEEQGRIAEAGAVAQKGYADALEARLTRVENRLGFIERGWRAVVGAAKDAWDAMLNIGRRDEVETQLNKLRNELETRQRNGPRLPGTEAAFEKGNQRLREQIQLLSESVRLESRVADQQKRDADTQRARIEFDREGDKFLTNRAKMEKEIAAARALGAAAGASQVEIESRIADIRKKFEDKGAARKALQIDKAQLNLDIEAIKTANEELIGSYANSERILEAIRSAGLVSDRDYYESKRAFIRLEQEAKEQALQAEIDRRKKEKLTDAAKLENDRKIADLQGKIIVGRAQASAALVVLATQEEAAANRVKVALLSARQAAEDYFDSLQRQQARDIEGIGQGSQRRAFNTGLNQIDDRFQQQRRELANQRALLELEGKFTEESRAQYDARLGIIEEFQAKAVQAYAAGFARMTELQRDWALGANEGLQNYSDNALNVFKSVEDAVGRTFKGLEDAITKFVSTGKLDFKSLADSIIADVSRIVVQTQITGPLAQWLQGGLMGGTRGNNPSAFVADSGDGFGGFLRNLLGGLFGGFRAAGGPVQAGKWYRVNERGTEMLTTKNGTSILAPGENGVVTPAGGFGGVVTVQNTFHINGPVDRRTQDQIAAAAAAGAQRALARNR